MGQASPQRGLVHPAIHNHPRPAMLLRSGGSARAIYEDMQTDLGPKLSEAGPPVALVVPVLPAAEDRSFSLQLKTLYSEVPELKVVPVKAARHFVMPDQPEVMTAPAEVFWTERRNI